MRALLVVLAGVALLVGVVAQPASAGKGTDIEQFIKRIEKFAIHLTSDQKPRVLCVCQDGGLFHTHVGALNHDGQLGDGSVVVQCLVRLFNPLGQKTGSGTCNTFEILSK